MSLAGSEETRRMEDNKRADCDDDDSKKEALKLTL